MNETTRQILEQVKNGGLSVDEAYNRLTTGITATPQAQTPKLRPRFLKVQVDSSDGDKVNIKLPLALLRTGVKLSALIPKQATDTIGEHGLDFGKLSELNEAELIEALAELEVTVDSQDGDKVRIFCE